MSIEFTTESGIIPEIMGWASGGAWQDWPDPAPVEEAASEQANAEPVSQTFDLGPDERPRGRSGLVLGRFMPPHRGHQFLVHVAQSFVETLTILIFSTPGDAIPLVLRQEWMQELFPKAHIFPVEHQEPLTVPDLLTNLERLGVKPDYLFSSEGYAHHLASLTGARYVPVDPSRTVVPVSASMIRENPLSQWRFIPSCVRPYYVRRIALLGPDDGEKRELAEHYGTVLVPDYARSWSPQGLEAMAPEDLQTVVLGQVAAGEALARQAEKALFYAGTTASLQVWSEEKFGKCPLWIREEVEQTRYHLTLVLDPGEDNTAGGPAPFWSRCITPLAARSNFLVTATGSKQDRMNAACKAIDEILA